MGASKFRPVFNRRPLRQLISISALRVALAAALEFLLSDLPLPVDMASLADRRSFAQCTSIPKSKELEDGWNHKALLLHVSAPPLAHRH
jgi:hypothetical protein